MNIFLMLPEKGSDCKYYIKPIDIINLREDNHGTLVSYLFGSKQASITTLITAREIQEEMVRMEEEVTMSFFSDLGE